MQDITEKYNAIVNSGNRKLICLVDTNIQLGQAYGQPADERVLSHHVILAKNCYELFSSMMAIPTPAGIATSYSTIVVPVDIEEDPVELWVFVDNIRLFKNMKDKGLKYINMVEEHERRMILNRAKRAGIEMTDEMPSGPTPRIRL